MSISQHYPCINFKDTEQTDNPLLQKQYGHLVGKHPDNVTIPEIEGAGHTNTPLVKIMREKCIECCGFEISEVRKCVSTTCPLWPYRMGKNPFQSAKYKNTAEV